MGTETWLEIHNEAIITGMVSFGVGMIVGIRLMFNEVRAAYKKALRR